MAFPASFISYVYYLVIDIFDMISELSSPQFELDLPYRHRMTQSDRDRHLTTPNLQASSSSAADMTKKILPVMMLEDLPTILNCTDHTCCAICLSEYEGKEEIRRLIFCNHIFHRSCLDRWIEYDHRLLCPLCRTALI
ncbi:hypothetical protein MKW94_016519 [Papaver nudicaule]|uniref:RING-type domain-containing protein n=1 Tax=Papaver nudicaule TaxID=74823 RepID=A0AA41SI67_PAPNU|nr:hypothetical protein [Papaver nudicaule]MCL7041571.1 hypothetical protein [Papaver nudicaule]